MVSEVSSAEFLLSNAELAFENINKALLRRLAKDTLLFEFGCVLRETCAEAGSGMDDGGGFLHAGEWRANKGIGCSNRWLVRWQVRVCPSSFTLVVR